MDDLISQKALLAEYDRVHIGEPGGARKLIEEAPAVQQWIPVSERLPEKHGKYLALTPSIIVECKYSTWLILYDPKRGFYDIDPEWGDIEIDTVTHWMPLPEMPKEG